jgi:hypothetical protein
MRGELFFGPPRQRSADKLLGAPPMAGMAAGTRSLKTCRLPEGTARVTAVAFEFNLLPAAGPFTGAFVLDQPRQRKSQ